MFFQDGYFKPLAVRKIGAVMTARQLVPALFVSSLLLAALFAPWLVVARLVLGVALGSYAGADLVAATTVARRAGWRVGLAASAAFPVVHCGYGLGYLLGVFDFLVREKRGTPPVLLSR